MPRNFNQELLDAVYNNDINKASKTLARGANIDHFNIYGETALHIAAINGYSELTDLLLSKNPRADIKDNIGFTALNWAEKKPENGILDKIKLHEERAGEYKKRWDSVYNAIDTAYKAGVSAAQQTGEYVASKAYEQSGYAYDLVDRLAKGLVGDPPEDLPERFRSENPAEQDLKKTNIIKEYSIPSSEEKPKSTNPRSFDSQAKEGSSDLMYSWGAWGIEKLYEFVDPIARYMTEERPSTYKFMSNDTKLKEGEIGISFKDDKFFVHTNDGKEIPINKANIPEKLYEKIAKKPKETADATGPALSEQEREILDSVISSASKSQAKKETKSNPAPSQRLLNAELIKAVLDGDIEKINEALEKGADINSKGKAGNTALHYAAMKGDLDTLDFLIAKEARLDIANNKGQTALHAAVLASDTETEAFAVVDSLLNSGADINAKDADGNTPLHYAALSSRDIINILFDGDRSPDVNTQNKEGNTALHLAAEFGDSERIEILIDKKASTDIINNDEKAPIHIALKNGINIERLIPTTQSLYNIPDAQGNTLTHHAALYFANTGRADLLLAAAENGADFSAANHLGITPQQIIINHAVNVAKEDVLAINEAKHLHKVALNGDEVQLKKLAAKGADINLKDDLGNTPAHYALLSANDNNLSALIDDLGADINIKNKSGISVKDVLDAPDLEQARLIAKIAQDIEQALSQKKITERDHVEEKSAKKMDMVMIESAEHEDTDRPDSPRTVAIPEDIFHGLRECSQGKDTSSKTTYKTPNPNSTTKAR